MGGPMAPTAYVAEDGLVGQAVKRLPIKYKSCLPKSAAVLRRKAHNYIMQGPVCLISLKFGNSNASKL